MMAVGRAVLDLRTAQGLSQVELAARCPTLGRTAIQKMEADWQRDVYLSTACELARALGVSVDALAGRSR